MSEPQLRTLTFGDRTISYDTGLHCLATGLGEGGKGGEGREGEGGFARRLVAREESVRSGAGEWDSGAGSDCSEEVEEVEGEEGGGEVEARGGGQEGVVMRRGGRGREDGDRRLLHSRSVIQPDTCAINQLLNFDEVLKVLL